MPTPYPGEIYKEIYKKDNSLGGHQVVVARLR